MTKKLSKILLMVLVCYTTFNTSVASEFDPMGLSAALDSAGNNRVELEKVIAHYASMQDSVKYYAAIFLISNMLDRSYVKFSLQDTVGNEYSLDVLSYPDFDSLWTSCQSLEEEHGELDFKKSNEVEDIKTITADFLIEQIDFAFKAWREKPWSGYLSFDQFCEYVLPYRGSSEPLEDWRVYFWNKYVDIAERMKDPTDPIEAAALINDDIISWFTFDSRFYLHPTDQGLSEMLKSGLGRCEDMTNLTIYAMRANGLAVTSDYTPYWAKTGNNHAWNAIVTREGTVVPFMGAESNPGEYELSHKAAKIYRKTYGQQRQNLVFQERKQESIPKWLAGKHYRDVTPEYMDVSSVSIEFDHEIPDSIDIAYLCVFNSGEWSPIHWGRIDKGIAFFNDMGMDIVYVPALYISEEMVPYGPPFILTEEGRISMLLSEPDMTDDMLFTSISDGINQVDVVSGKEYELFYWDKDWVSHDRRSASDNGVLFSGIPRGTLYWLKADDSQDTERIFTISDGKPIWW